MRVCGEPGCPEVTPHPRCPAHTQKPWAGSTRRARLPRDWDRIRRRILGRDPVCKVCHAARSTQVDHIVNNDDHRPENLQGICEPCHRAKTQHEAAQARRK